jgi:hypothetical protein
MDIGRTPIISKAALPSWCGSDVKTNSGGQGIKALASAAFYLNIKKTVHEKAIRFAVRSSHKSARPYTKKQGSEAPETQKQIERKFFLFN